jgi:hypothetical protein
MLDPRHLFRASMWVRNPPSASRVKFVFGIIAIAIVIFGIEWFGFWPEWATAERIQRKF